MEIKIVEKNKFVDKKFSISYTKIEKYQRCPFEYKCYVDKRIYKLYHKDTPALVFGQLIHGVLNSFYKQLEPEERNLDNMRKLFKKKYLAHKQKHDKIFQTKENVTYFVNEAKKQFNNFLKSPYALVEPYVATEEIQIEEVGGIEFLAKVDRIDKDKSGLRIIDYKTGKLWEENPDPLQLNFYSFVISRKFPELPIVHKSYFYLAEGKDVDIKVGPTDNQEVLELTKEIVDQITKDKKFEPRKNDKCRFCDFISFCPLMIRK